MDAHPPGMLPEAGRLAWSDIFRLRDGRFVVVACDAETAATRTRLRMTAELALAPLPVLRAVVDGARNAASVPAPTGCAVILDPVDGTVEAAESGTWRIRLRHADGRAPGPEAPARGGFARGTQLVLAAGERSGDPRAIVIPLDPASACVRRWRVACSAADELHEVRRLLRALFEEHLTSEAASAAEVVLGELLGNVVRHAPGSAEVALDLAGREPVLHVLDDGPGFAGVPALPNDPFSESGRGLYIASALTARFAVTRRTGGGTHARAVLARSAGS